MADATLSLEARLANVLSPGLRGVTDDVVAANRRVNESADQTSRSNAVAANSYKPLVGTMAQTARVAGTASLAMGSLGGSAGVLGKAAVGATSALALFGSGLTGIALPITAAILGLSALISYFDSVNQKAQEASEAALKKSTDQAQRIAAASKIVVSAQIRSEISAVGDNPLRKLEIQQREELKGFKGTEEQKSRILEAHAKERSALLATEHKKRVDAETSLTKELAETQISTEKQGFDREIALIRLRARTRLEAAVKSGADEGFARLSIAEQTEAQIAEVEKRRAAEKASIEHRITTANIEQRNTGFSRERALLEENYRFEVDMARRKGEDTTAIEAEFSAKRVELRRNEQQQIASATFQLASNSLSFISAIQDVEASRVRKRTAERIELIDSQEKQGVLSKRRADKQREELEKETEKRLRRLAERGKVISRLQAIINVAEGITKAIAQGGILGLATGITVGAAGATQIAKIEAQEFATGGFPIGQNALVRLNENGQEAVLNASAVQNIGRDRIERLNSGDTTVLSGDQNKTTNNVTFAPQNVINLGNGSGTLDVVKALEQQQFEFFRFMDMAVKRGFKFG